MVSYWNKCILCVRHASVTGADACWRRPIAGKRASSSEFTPGNWSRRRFFHNLRQICTRKPATPKNSGL